MDFFKMAMGGGLLLFGAFIIFCGYSRQIHNFKNRRRKNASWSSPVPFVGPIFVLVGLNALSVELSAWALLIFALDPDTALTVIYFPIFLVKQFGRS